MCLGQGDSDQINVNNQGRAHCIQHGRGSQMPALFTRRFVAVYPLVTERHFAGNKRIRILHNRHLKQILFFAYRACHSLPCTAKQAKYSKRGNLQSSNEQIVNRPNICTVMNLGMMYITCSSNVITRQMLVQVMRFSKLSRMPWLHVVLTRRGMTIAGQVGGAMSCPHAKLEGEETTRKGRGRVGGSV